MRTQVPPQQARAVAGPRTRRCYQQKSLDSFHARLWPSSCFFGDRAWWAMTRMSPTLASWSRPSWASLRLVVPLSSTAQHRMCSAHCFGSGAAKTSQRREALGFASAAASAVLDLDRNWAATVMGGWKGRAWLGSCRRRAPWMGFVRQRRDRAHMGGEREKDKVAVGGLARPFFYDTYLHRPL
jgi:hypothetical protein